MINRIVETIKDHRIELYVLEKNEARNYSESYFASHFPDRYERSKKFRFEADRQRCLCVGILLYEILGLEDKDIHFTEHGKPYPASDNDKGKIITYKKVETALDKKGNSNHEKGDSKQFTTNYETKRFNVSHSGDFVVLAVSDLEIGVDIERPDREYLDIGKRVFTDAELLWIDNEDINDKESLMMDPSARFMLLWTMKESVSKAIGLGLGLDYRSFDALELLKNGRFTAFEKQIVGKAFFFEEYIIFASLIIE